MGCDIHLQIEIKINGKWVWINKFLPKEISKSAYHFLPISRNYNLFGILADVRNGLGFAGCDTGNGFVPISQPKGIPKNMDSSLAKEHKKYYLLGDHSFSYLTGKELKEYNWDRIVKHRGWVNAKEYIEFKEKGKPSGWCGGVNGPNVEHCTNQEMEKRIKEDRVKECYTSIEWSSTYIDSVGFGTYWCYKEFYGLLTGWNEKINPDDVRIVFGFDS